MASVFATRKNKEEGNPKPVVWNAKLCPFAERVIFALNELKIYYDQKDIDLFNKPSRLYELNPSGKVPVIEDLGKVLYESMICIEYLDESYQSPTGKRLLPKEPINKAIYRMINEYVGSQFTPKFYGIIHAKTKEESDKIIKEFLGVIAEIDSKMRKLSSDGPFFAGADVSYLDIMLVPFVRRFCVLENCRDFSIPDKPEYVRFRKWMEASFEYPVYKKIKAAMEDEEIVTLYKEYMKLKK